MKKKILIIATTMIAIAIGVPKTYAATPEQWALNLPSPTDVRWFDCTSSTSCATQLNTTYLSQTNPDTFDTYAYVVGDQTATIGSNGVLLAYQSPVGINHNYVYNITLYHCSNKNLSGSTFQVYAQTYGNRANATGNWLNYATNETLSHYAYTTHQQTANYCYATKSLFYSNEVTDTIWVFLKIKNSSAISGYVPAFISMDVQPVGLYTEVMRDIVENAIRNGTTGLATSSQLTQAQNSINSTINNGANQVEDAINDTNDILTENHTYNNNASETIQGQNDLNTYSNSEQNLLNSLDMEVEDAEVTINPNASSMIWGIVNTLRGLSSKIILLFTSVLSLGLIKMILNR